MVGLLVLSLHAFSNGSLLLNFFACGSAVDKHREEEWDREEREGRADRKVAVCLLFLITEKSRRSAHAQS